MSEVHPPLAHACPLCGAAIAIERLAEAGRVCTTCGATCEGAELALAILATLCRGLHANLTAAAVLEPLASARVVDLSGDRVLGSLLGTRDGLADPGNTASRYVLDPIGALDGATGDLVVMRNALFTAPDLDALLDAAAQAVLPGGWLIVQETLVWPLPASTSATAANDDAVPTRPVAGGLRLAIRREVGADVVDRFRQRGLFAEVQRPFLATDPIYRRALIAAERP